MYWHVITYTDVFMYFIKALYLTYIFDKWPWKVVMSGALSLMMLEVDHLKAHFVKERQQWLDMLSSLLSCIFLRIFVTNWSIFLFFPETRQKSHLFNFLTFLYWNERSNKTFGQTTCCVLRIEGRKLLSFTQRYLNGSIPTSFSGHVSLES